jgi:sugar diacid utilization regulator
VPAWAAELLAADDRARGALVDTLRAYADADMSVLGAARALGVHANTIYARFERIEDVTGLDARRYRALDELLLAVDVART